MRTVQKFKARKKGFSIIEILVAGTFLTIAIVSAFSLLGPAIQKASYTNDVLIASMLAQEGIELVMNIRDTNWYEDFNNPPFGTPDAWWEDLGVNDNQFDLRTGVMDYNDSLITYTAALAGCSTVAATEPERENDILANCQATALYLDSNNFYNHDGSGQVSDFRRIVKVERSDLGGGKKKLTITTIVRWGDYNTNRKEVRLTSYLYDWMSMN